MNYTQNRKIAQVTETTLVVGVDIGSQWHYARAFDWRGIEITKKAFRFSNDLDGYTAFEKWFMRPLKTLLRWKCSLVVNLQGITGYVCEIRWSAWDETGVCESLPCKTKQGNGRQQPRKTDEKDPKTIAKLVTEGRYSFPYLPTGIYAELREAMSVRDRS